MRFKEFQTKCETATGKKRYALAFLLGAAMTLTTPPIGIAPLLLFCVPGLVYLTINAERRESFLSGWAFGSGYFIFGLYWVSAALFVDIGQWGWVLPLSAVAGPAVLAVFYGFIPLLARRWRGEPAAYALAIVAAWSGIEWLRGHVMTGFPWNLPGYSWHWGLPVMQASAVLGFTV